MFVCDVAEKVLDTELFAQRAIADLNLWHCIYCFAQSGKALTVKRNKHARARNQHIFPAALTSKPVCLPDSVMTSCILYDTWL